MFKKFWIVRYKDYICYSSFYSFLLQRQFLLLCLFLDIKIISVNIKTEHTIYVITVFSPTTHLLRKVDVAGCESPKQSSTCPTEPVMAIIVML